MNLTREQRRRLLDGNYEPLTFKDRPQCEEGQQVVVAWTEEQRHWDGGRVVVVAPQPLLELEVLSVRRRNKGGWAVRFNVTDRSHSDRYVARIAGYTSSPALAVDEFPAVDEEYQKRLSDLGRQRDRESAPERLEQRRRDAERRKLGWRLDEARRRARQAGIDVTADERVIEERLVRMERKVDRAA